ncbi:putative non-specific serine/threonine protein kinase [Helianthus annuus]|nr:putative non-specific serine/threonine protein kinase [Helianthus annuus]
MRKVNLLSWYLLVAMDGGYRNVTTENIWPAIVKDMGFNYEDGDYMRVTYAAYLDVLEYYYNFKQVQKEMQDKKTVLEEGTSTGGRQGSSKNAGVTKQDSTEMETVALFAVVDDEDWNKGKRRKHFNFNYAKWAMDEANRSVLDQVRDKRESFSNNCQGQLPANSRTAKTYMYKLMSPETTPGTKTFPYSITICPPLFYILISSQTHTMQIQFGSLPDTYLNDVNTSAASSSSDPQQNLLICSGDNTVIWSSNLTVSAMNDNLVVVVQLLDTGNLVVWDRSTNNESVIWQSFDHPGNTFLPGMKMGKDLASGRERVIIPWKSADDPSPGPYLHWLDTNGYPQIFVRKGSVLRRRSGPWNGLKFQGWSVENPNPIYSIQFVMNEKEIYYKYELKDSVVQRFLVLPDDIIVHLRWMDQTQEWVVQHIGAATNSCGGYGLCGPYASCNANRYPPCKCMAGFKPQVPDEWDRANGSSGCERKQDLDCMSGSGFKRISGIVFPDTRRSWYNHSMTLEECELACRMKCNCVGPYPVDDEPQTLLY